jgi:hypothetical protein
MDPNKNNRHCLSSGSDGDGPVFFTTALTSAPLSSTQQQQHRPTSSIVAKDNSVRSSVKLLNNGNNSRQQQQQQQQRKRKASSLPRSSHALRVGGDKSSNESRGGTKKARRYLHNANGSGSSSSNNNNSNSNNINSSNSSNNGIRKNSPVSLLTPPNSNDRINLAIIDENQSAQSSTIIAPTVNNNNNANISLSSSPAAMNVWCGNILRPPQNETDEEYIERAREGWSQSLEKSFLLRYHNLPKNSKQHAAYVKGRNTCMNLWVFIHNDTETTTFLPTESNDDLNDMPNMTDSTTKERCLYLRSAKNVSTGVREQKIGQTKIEGQKKANYVRADRKDLECITFHKVFSMDSGNTYDAEKRFVAKFDSTVSQLHEINGSPKNITIREAANIECNGLPFVYQDTMKQLEGSGRSVRGVATSMFLNIAETGLTSR